MDVFRGRLEKAMDNDTLNFISSVDEDKKIVETDIEVIEAHCLMLHSMDILRDDEVKKVLEALNSAREDSKSGKLLDIMKNRTNVDIHPLIEEYIINHYGMEVGGKTHTAKSRNDQVVTDMHIFMRDKIIEISRLLLDVLDGFLDLAQQHKETIMPGYTHMQHAQTTTFSHYLLAYVDCFIRDIKRLIETYKSVNLNPLGACALAGSNLEIDRHYTAELLGFDGILENTIDAISNRDIILEFVSKIAIISTTLSRIARDFIFWSSYEYGFLNISDEIADTSTAMPQKKNPDCLEMINGKSGKINGRVTQCFDIVSGLSTGYSRDLQEVKSVVFEVTEDIKSMLKILHKVVVTTKINPDRMLQVIKRNYIAAVDFAEHLITRGWLPFRESHYLVGNLVKRLSSEGRELQDITSEYLADISRSLLNKEINIPQEELEQLVNPLSSIYERKSHGGPSPKEVERLLNDRKEEVKNLRDTIEEKEERVKNAKENFEKEKWEILTND